MTLNSPSIRFSRTLALLLSLGLFPMAVHAQSVPFHRGVNLTNWFQAYNVQNIPLNAFTRRDFDDLLRLGCDVVRVPVNMHAMIGPPPAHAVDPLLLDFLDRAVDLAEATGIHIIIDNHSFDPAVVTYPSVVDTLIPLWTQLASHFKGRSRLVLYEILNEPHGIGDSVWNAIQGSAIAAIRNVDSIHTIVVGGAGWNSYHNLRPMPVYADTNLIYTFHFYDPFLFTHQGASWSDPSLVPLAGVPFPPDPARMPPLPASLAGTWIASAHAGYANDGSTAAVRQLLKIAAEFRDQRKVPVFCGEFGVYIPNSDNDDRVRWYGFVRTLLDSCDIPWTTWDYRGGFGLFEKGSSELFDHDLNVPLLQALGLTVPPQSDFVVRPDSATITLYDDMAGPGTRMTGWMFNGTFSAYSAHQPDGGAYCMSWSGGDRYTSIAFDFVPDRDFSRLASAGAVFEMSIRSELSTLTLDVRFLDTKRADLVDHPWRMRYTITPATAVWDGRWNHLRIPLSAFSEGGSWDDNAWYDAVGAFQWSEVDRWELAAEHHTMAGAQVWVDDVRITAPASAVEEPGGWPEEIRLSQNYPNPFNPSTAIAYALRTTGHVKLAVYDLLGREVSVLVDDVRAAGTHQVVWSAPTMPSGVYVCRLTSGESTQTRKLVLMK